MKQRLLLSLFVLSAATMAWADVEINEENFPDVNFRGFLLEQEYGSDGVLTEAEIAGIASINVREKFIQSLKGVEYFTALKELEYNQNQLTSLDVSKNLALTSLGCSSNQLTSLDVSQNTALTSLICWSNQLTALDVSKNTLLEELYCPANQLTELDVTKNTALTGLVCGGNPIKTLDVSQNPELISLMCSDCQLTSLDVSKNPALEELDCEMNELTSLDVSNNPELYALGIYQNRINGENMDALVESMPTLTEGYMYVLYYENEENVMTAKQAAAAKAKGWLLYHCPGLDEKGRETWQEYEGGTGIEEMYDERWTMDDGSLTPALSKGEGTVYDLSGRKMVNGQCSMVNAQWSMVNCPRVFTS